MQFVSMMGRQLTVMTAAFLRVSKYNHISAKELLSLKLEFVEYQLFIVVDCHFMPLLVKKVSVQAPLRHVT